MITNGIGWREQLSAGQNRYIFGYRKGDLMMGTLDTGYGQY
ncbi:hypothetical protein [Neobacillus piezotolerans]|nr:hypothetical protein [Neobacillus piezotolerans]